MAIGIIVILYFVGILTSLFLGGANFSSVGEGRTSVHVGIFLLSWGALIPVSAKYTRHSFIFRWMLAIEKVLLFGKTGIQYLAFNTVIILFFGVLLTLIGLGITHNG